MKTLFIVAPCRVNAHVGEEYDEIVEVVDEPTTENIQEWSNRIRQKVRDLYAQDVTVPDPKVVATFDAPTPFRVVLVNLSIIMKAEEGILLEVPQYVPPVIHDPEAVEALKKLDSRR